MTHMGTVFSSLDTVLATFNSLFEEKSNKFPRFSFDKVVLTASN